MSEGRKPTFKELLERHGIDFHYFYENCFELPTTEINVLYNGNMCTKAGLEKMLAFVNTHAHTSYTIEDIYVVQMY